jgi:hypothetical protein
VAFGSFSRMIFMGIIEEEIIANEKVKYLAVFLRAYIFALPFEKNR